MYKIIRKCNKTDICEIEDVSNQRKQCTEIACYHNKCSHPEMGKPVKWTTKPRTQHRAGLQYVRSKRWGGPNPSYRSYVRISMGALPSTLSAQAYQDYKDYRKMPRARLTYARPPRFVYCAVDMMIIVAWLSICGCDSRYALRLSAANFLKCPR